MTDIIERINEALNEMVVQHKGKKYTINHITGTSYVDIWQGKNKLGSELMIDPENKKEAIKIINKLIG